MNKSEQILVNKLFDGETFNDVVLDRVLRRGLSALHIKWADKSNHKITCEMTLKFIELVSPHSHSDLVLAIAQYTKHETVMNYILLNAGLFIKIHLAMNIHCSREIIELLSNNESGWARLEVKKIMARHYVV